MLRFLTALLLAALLLSPAAAPAQTPNPAKAQPRRVSIQVTYVVASENDVDALGINFNLRPLYSSSADNQGHQASPAQEFLRFAMGDTIPQLYHLILTASAAIVDAPLTVWDGSPAIFDLSATVADYTAPPAPGNELLRPQLKGPLKVQGGLTLVPHINSDNTVSLDTSNPLNPGKMVRLLTTASGQQSVIIPALIGRQDAAANPRGWPRITNSPVLLVFITPTIIAAAPVPASVPEKTITLDTVNADLHSVVAMLEKHAGIKAIVQDGSRPYRPVTLHLQTMSLPKVIRSIAFSTGATATQNADGVCIFAPEEAVGSAEPVSATSAQISTPAKVTPRSVAIKVEFLPVYKADLDSFGVNFIPLPDTLLSYTTGNIASQLFQVLTRTGGRRGHDTLVTTSDNVAGGISVDTEVYDAMCHAAPAKALPGTSGQPEFFHLQGMLAFTPHITSNRFVRIDISPANIDDKPLEQDKRGAASSAPTVTIRIFPLGRTLQSH